ncbi:M56 family metallopeptidase [Paucibacter sp. APW11]|uniref:M56 family metallopeptidase n=1 Tax=Roseateles aquae TaxID=3077235 RepID=A0ABU3PE29_9BURK|nr:M56 family metallopeptidase [Paucibacter sp. APW11]MDT9000855.1 M56 family metallopeptidase [Paucibacter sp. APW11]
MSAEFLLQWQATLLERWVPALGLALLHFVWQGLLIALLAGLLLALLRRAGPRPRYAVCAGALLLSLLLPLGQFVWLINAAPDAGSLQAAAELPLEAPDWWQTLLEQLPQLVLAWSLGVTLMGARLALGLAWVAQLRRRAALRLPQELQAWQARLDALARRMGLRRHVRLQLSAQVDSPLTMGFWRPLVLLPAALLSGLPAPLLEALLAHELAHVRRHDYLINLLQSLVEALLFFHPAVWWLSDRMRRERELVADELAAAVIGDARQLALALHELSLINDKSATAPNSLSPLTLSARGGDLLQRIHALVIPRQATPSWKLALPALTLALSSLLVQAQARTQPPKAAAASTAAATPSTPAASGVVTPAPEAPLASAFKLPVNAKHALVLEEGSGKVLMEKNADAVVPIASLTKLMTAMVVLDAKPNMNEKIQIAQDDVDTLKHSASRVRVGAEMSRLAALKLALMQSENRAAAALARTYPGGLAAFELAVKAKIRALGLTRTAISEPTGLSPANTSTAADVARMAAAAARYPEIAQITSEKKDIVPVNGKPREVRNTNRLVGAKGWDIRLSKTGYTEEAGRCLTMRMVSGGKPVTVVLLDADGSAQRLRDAAKIRQSLNKLHS